MWSEPQAYSYSDGIISSLNCNTNSSSQLLSCLHAATPQQLMQASASISVFYAMLHPYEITEQPINLITDHTYNAVPLLAGTNLDEMSLFLCPAHPNGINSSEYLLALTQLYGKEKAQQIFAVYPVSDYPSALQALIAVQSDAFFRCTTKNATHYSLSPAYLYSFEHVPSFSSPCYGVAHSYELPFLFPGSIGKTITQQEQVLARNMIDAWSSFVITGIPSMPLVPNLVWTAVGMNNSYIILDFPPRMASNFEPNCVYWQ